MDQDGTTQVSLAALDDRSTRARIRDAAMRQFAEHGFRGATIRGIASSAGVSPGLVQHHFGTKQALREACDDHVFAVIERAMEGYRVGEIASPDFLNEIVQTMTPLVDYMATMLAEGSTTASQWFDLLVDFNREMLIRGDMGRPLSKEDDVTAIAAVLTVIQLGFMTMWDHVLRALGAAGNDPKTIARVGRARLLVASGGLLNEEVMARAHEGLDRYEQTYSPASAARGAAE